MIQIFSFFTLILCINSLAASDSPPKCFNIVQRLTAKINEVQDFEVGNFLDLCHTFGKCRTAGLAGEEEDIWNYCEATKYFFQQFVECDQKITNNGSKCNANWNPFPDTSVAVDEVEREQMKRAACRDFFGVDDCMREEVSNECGAEEWEEFKQHLLNVNKMSGQCDFGETRQS